MPFCFNNPCFIWLLTLKPFLVSPPSSYSTLLYWVLLLHSIWLFSALFDYFILFYYTPVSSSLPQLPTLFDGFFFYLMGSFRKPPGTSSSRWWERQGARSWPDSLNQTVMWPRPGLLQPTTPWWAWNRPCVPSTWSPEPLQAPLGEVRKGVVNSVYMGCKCTVG